MVTRYSQGKGKTPSVEKQFTRILKTSEQLRVRLLELVDLDAQAYQGIVRARKLSIKEKKKAEKEAQAISKEVCKQEQQRDRGQKT